LVFRTEAGHGQALFACGPATAAFRFFEFGEENGTSAKRDLTCDKFGGFRASLVAG